jgi:hypothetical protein
MFEIGDSTPDDFEVAIGQRKIFGNQLRCENMPETTRKYIEILLIEFLRDHKTRDLAEVLHPTNFKIAGNC